MELRESKDGEELSAGDFSKPLLFDGFYSAPSLTLYKMKPVYVRADSGERFLFSAGRNTWQ